MLYEEEPHPSVNPVWTCGWPSQTRRRRPEKSVRTDQLGLRGQCVLRRTARFLAPPTPARPRLLLRCAGSRVDRPVVGPLCRDDRTLTLLAGFRCWLVCCWLLACWLLLSCSCSP